MNLPPDVLSAQLELDRAIRFRIAAVVAIRQCGVEAVHARLEEHKKACELQAQAQANLNAAIAAEMGVEL